MRPLVSVSPHLMSLLSFVVPILTLSLVFYEKRRKKGLASGRARKPLIITAAVIVIVSAFVLGIAATKL